MLCSAALSRRFPVHDRRCRSSFDDHTGSAAPTIQAVVVHRAEPAHLGSVAEDLGRRTPQCISVVAIPTRSVIAMVTAEVVVEVSRVQRVDSQLVTKVSTGCPQGEPPAARPHRATAAQPDRTGLSRKTGSVILPGEGGLTGAPVPLLRAKPTPTGAGRGCWRGRARSTRPQPRREVGDPAGALTGLSCTRPPIRR